MTMLLLLLTAAALAAPQAGPHDTTAKQPRQLLTVVAVCGAGLLDEAGHPLKPGGQTSVGARTDDKTRAWLMLQTGTSLFLNPGTHIVLVGGELIFRSGALEVVAVGSPLRWTAPHHSPNRGIVVAGRTATIPLGPATAPASSGQSRCLASGPLLPISLVPIRPPKVTVSKDRRLSGSIWETSGSVMSGDLAGSVAGCGCVEAAGGASPNDWSSGTVQPDVERRQK